MENLLQDLRYGARLLVNSPGFTVVVVLTLALGIGANSAIFTVVNAVLLRPLPYDQADRLVFFTEWSEQVPNMSFSVANFKDLRDQSTLFESMVAYRSNNYVLTGEGEPERMNGRQVSSGFFATMRIRPILGRGFTFEEDSAGADRVALISEGLWERRFGRDPNILGRNLMLSGVAFTVIGVLPAGLHGSWNRTDIFSPLLPVEDQIGGPQRRGSHPGIYVVARLKAGATVEQARAEVVGIAQRLAQQYPNSNARQSMTVRSLHEAAVGTVSTGLWMLLAAVAFVLLIACVNVANLLLARAVSRRREIAVRAALGAGRTRMVRQLLTESVLMSVCGGILGLGVAWAGVQGLLAAIPPEAPRMEEVRVDGTVLAFTLLLSLLTGVLFGTVPAWHAVRADLNETLKEGSRGSQGKEHHTVRSTLVVAEVALSLLLLIAAGLMMRSFFKVMAVDPGIRPEGVLTATVPLPQIKYGEPQLVRAALHRILEEIQALPGVSSAGATLPLLGGWQNSFLVEGRPMPAAGQAPSTDLCRVSPGYFQAMGVRLLQGRVFNDQDHAEATRVCIVDETFVRTYWPGENPIGKRIRFNDQDEPWMEVVGVVAHVKNYGVEEDSRVETYIPFDQAPIGFFTLVIRSTGDPAALTPSVRRAVRNVDPDVPIYDARTMEDRLAEDLAGRRLGAVLILGFAALALVLAAIGIYGVTAYTVTQRTGEIGIRVAMGAGPKDVLRLVLRQGMSLALIGVVIGLGAAFALARLVASLLFQVSVIDPPTYSLTPLIMAIIALLACYLPARRAMKVDPMTALRRE